MATRKKTAKEAQMAAEIPSATEFARTGVEIPQSAAEIALHSVDQAQAAFDKASDFAHDNVQMFDAAAGVIKSNAAELQLKAMEIAQANTNALFAHLRRLLEAGEPNQVVMLSQTYLADQMQAYLKQTAEINELALKFAAESTKPVHEGLMRSLDGWQKAFNA